MKTFKLWAIIDKNEEIIMTKLDKDEEYHLAIFKKLPMPCKKGFENYKVVRCEVKIFKD